MQRHVIHVVVLLITWFSGKATGCQLLPWRWYKNSFTNVVLLQCGPCFSMNLSCQNDIFIEMKWNGTKKRPANFSLPFFLCIYLVWILSAISMIFICIYIYMFVQLFFIQSWYLKTPSGNNISSGALQPTIGAKPPFSDIALELDDQRIYASGDTPSGFLGTPLIRFGG